MTTIGVRPRRSVDDASQAKVSREAFFKQLEASAGHVQAFTEAVVQTRQVAEEVTQRGFFQSFVSPYRNEPLGKLMFFGLLSTVEGLVRGHGAREFEMNREEVARVLAAGYDQLEGLEKQIVGHMLTRQVYGADNSFASNEFWFTDQRTKEQFAGIRAGLDRLPVEERRRLEGLTNTISSALFVAKRQADPAPTEGERMREQVRADLSKELRNAYCAMPLDTSSYEGGLADDEVDAIVDYAMHVYDAAYSAERTRRSAARVYETK
jgi:hypothetical protein